MAAAAGSKVFILDKYFYELQRFWDAEKKTESRIIFCCCLIRSADHNFLMIWLIIFPSHFH